MDDQDRAYINSMKMDRLKSATAEDIDEAALPIVEMVTDGWACPVETAAWMRNIKAMADTVLKEIEEDLQAAADDFDGRTVGGFKLERAEVGVKYDYASCEDTAWEQMDAERKGLAARIKEREKWLKMLPGPMADPDTGNVVTPPVKSSKTTLKFTRDRG